MKLKNSLLMLSSFLALTLSTSYAGEQIRIVGSSTVFPFTSMAAEKFAIENSTVTPIVESTGTGGGIKLFCAGIGEGTPDMVNASRKIKESELKTCKENGVTSVTEVMLGYDGIVLASKKGSKIVDLSTKEVFLALAKKIARFPPHMRG